MAHLDGGMLCSKEKTTSVARPGREVWARCSQAIHKGRSGRS